MTSQLFAGPLSADCPDVEKVPPFDGYFEFRPKNLQKDVKICNSDALFFLVEQFPTYGRSSNFQHWMVGR